MLLALDVGSLLEDASGSLPERQPFTASSNLSSSSPVFATSAIEADPDLVIEVITADDKLYRYVRRRCLPLTSKPLTGG